MSIVTRAHLDVLVKALKSRGVRFPERYPPANLDPASAHFRGVWAEVETLVLLARRIDPRLLELVDWREAGDTDIIIHLFPPLRLQVKGPLAVSVRSDLGITFMVRSARAEALRRFRAETRTHWKGVFSTIRIHLDEGREVQSGTSFSVNHPSPVHAAIVQVEMEVLSPMAEKNLQRWIRKAVGQLARYKDNSLLVPVLNVNRYPLDQAKAYKLVREVLNTRPCWRENVAGIILILRGYGDRNPDSGLHVSDLRLVGIENPQAPEGRRLRPEMFNPRLLDEELYSEGLVVISVEPPSEPYRIENGLLWVGNTLFGALPDHVGEPSMVVAL